MHGGMHLNNNVQDIIVLCKSSTISSEWVSRVWVSSTQHVWLILGAVLIAWYPTDTDKSKQHRKIHNSIQHNKTNQQKHRTKQAYYDIQPG